MPRSAVAAPPMIAREDDPALRARAQARLPRDGRLHDLDLLNLAKEARSFSASRTSEIRRHPRVPIAHLLNGRDQPGRRGASWRATIGHRRIAVREVIAARPSPRRHPAEVAPSAVEAGRLLAARETGIDFSLFPEAPPVSIEEILDDAFLPREPDLEGTTP